MKRTFDITIQSHIDIKEGETINVHHSKYGLDAEALLKDFCDFTAKYSPIACTPVDEEFRTLMDTLESCDKGDDIDPNNLLNCLKCLRDTSNLPRVKDSPASAENKTDASKKPEVNLAKGKHENALARLEIPHDLNDTEWWLSDPAGHEFLDHVIDITQNLRKDANQLCDLWANVNDSIRDAKAIAVKYGVPDDEMSQAYHRASGAFDDVHDSARMAIWRKALELLREQNASTQDAPNS